jgi:hypothetical protein
VLFVESHWFSYSDKVWTSSAAVTDIWR